MESVKSVLHDNTNLFFLATALSARLTLLHWTSLSKCFDGFSRLENCISGGFRLYENGITWSLSFSHHKHLPGLRNLGKLSWSLDPELRPSQLRILSYIYPSSSIFSTLAYLEGDPLLHPVAGLNLGNSKTWTYTFAPQERHLPSDSLFSLDLDTSIILHCIYHS